MSLTGNIHKVSGDVRSAINQIAHRGMTGMDGAVRGTKKIWGYVCNIHEDGDLAGTIDVQEFNYEPDEYEDKGTGHHEGVLLSAIQENKDGVLIVPMLYSEVVICQNPTDGQEYVLMYSHAQRIQMKARSEEGKDDGKIEIGVAEVEKFNETDDGLDKDYDELEPTKNETSTVYTSQSITDHIASKDDEEGLKQEKTAAHKIVTVGDTTITIDGENVSIQTSGKVSLTVGGTSITEEDGTVNIKTDKATVEGSEVTITGGNLKTKGTSSTDLQGPFNAIKVCPFSGAPHCGSTVSGT